MLKSVFQPVASSYPTNTLTFLDLVVVKMAVRSSQEFVTLEMEGQFEYNLEYIITCSVLLENSIFGKMFKVHPGVSKMELVW